MIKNKIIIGTSGWHYKHWIGTFYPLGTKPKDQMEYFLQSFKTVELNNSFYMVPARSTFESWRKSTPHDFLFAVKANRFITHMKKLKDVRQSLDNFLLNAEGLEEKLGPILFQLPPGWKINLERLKDFLEILPPQYKYTFEFRNPTWYNDQVYELLRLHKCAFCIYELAGHFSPIVITADFVYVRLHGPEGKYAGNYSEETLQQWARECKNWTHAGKSVYVYFDNDQLGYAAFNAKRLIELVCETDLI